MPAHSAPISLRSLGNDVRLALARLARGMRSRPVSASPDLRACRASCAIHSRTYRGHSSNLIFEFRLAARNRTTSPLMRQFRSRCSLISRSSCRPRRASSSSSGRRSRETMPARRTIIVNAVSPTRSSLNIESASADGTQKACRIFGSNRRRPSNGLGRCRESRTVSILPGMKSQFTRNEEPARRGDHAQPRS
jgi:hypothetical protein